MLKDFLLGGTSGCIAKTCCAPLERVKIVLQVQAADPSIPPGQGYKGMLDCYQGIVKEGGVAALWRGNVINCLRYFPTQAIGFACKEKYQTMLVRPKEEVGFGLWFAGYLAAGGAAGATALTFVYPLEFAYTRLAGDTTGKFSGLSSVLGSIYKTDGISGLYRGFQPSVVGIIIYRAGYFGFYDAGKSIIFGDDGNPSFLQKFVLALNVDIAAATFAYPIDTIRRRLMMQSGKAAADVQYTTMGGCVSHIMKNEGGVGAFYKGCFANNTRAIASALVLVLYDELKVFFK